MEGGGGGCGGGGRGGGGGEDTLAVCSSRLSGLERISFDLCSSFYLPSLLFSRLGGDVSTAILSLSLGLPLCHSLFLSLFRVAGLERACPSQEVEQDTRFHG